MAAQAVQVQQPPETLELPESPTGEKLSLEQMTRIMDVAATLRKEQAVVEQQLNIDQIKAKLRERLLEAAKVSGDPVTAEQIDAAIEQYYDQLHEFREPPLGFRSFFAHLWVRRRPIVAAIFGLVTLWALLWGLLAFGFLPGKAQNARIFSAIEREAAAVQELARDADVAPELATLVASAKAALEQGDKAKLAQIAAEISAIEAELASEYTVVIASGSGEQSGLERIWTDESGSRTSGYYVIVEARGRDGQPVRVPIASREQGAEGPPVMTSRWAEQVPQDVFERLEADKRADGVLDEHVFGVKHRGDRGVEVQLKSAAGGAIERQGQITSWQ